MAPMVDELFSGFARAFADTCAAHGAAVGDLWPRGADTHSSKTPQVEYNMEQNSCSTDDANVYVIGDLHADAHKAFTAYRLAGLVDINGRWAANKPGTVAVQLGDVLDRGNSGEVSLLLTQERLRQEAAASGCAHIGLLGNHEVMALRGDVRYASECACADFKRWEAYRALGAQLERLGSRLHTLPTAAIADDGEIRTSCIRAAEEKCTRCATRCAMLEPGSSIARTLLGNRATVSVLRKQQYSAVFAHGGLLGKQTADYSVHHSSTLHQINHTIATWVREGDANGVRTPPADARGKESILWSRHFSRENEESDCEALQAALSPLQASRLHVGHTIQKKGINAACDGAIVRADAGMSAGCLDAPPQVVEINPNGTAYKLVCNNTIHCDQVVRTLLDGTPKR